MVWNVTATRAAGGICYFIPILPCHSSFAAPCTWWGRRPRSSGSRGAWVCLQPHLRTASSTGPPRVFCPSCWGSPGMGQVEGGCWEVGNIYFFFFFFYLMLLLPLPFDFGDLRDWLCPCACPITFTMIHLYRSVRRMGLVWARVSCRFWILRMCVFEALVLITCLSHETRLKL